jgi:glutaryl-CoA dehydrogenase (non-decarboxylating)
MGWLGATVPKTYGSLGLDFVSLAIIAEELERGDAGIRTLLSVPLALYSMTLLKFCPDSQKQKFLVPQARGTALAAFGLTEPEGGQ